MPARDVKFAVKLVEADVSWMLDMVLVMLKNDGCDEICHTYSIVPKVGAMLDHVNVISPSIMVVPFAGLSKFNCDTDNP